MNVLICRLVQGISRVAEAFLPWREPELLTGEGSVLLLAQRMKADGVRRPLIVTGPTLHRLGVVNSLCEALDKAGLPAVVFDRVANDPTIANVEDARSCYLQNACDAIIAFGGGSPMDCAKVCGARITRPDKTVPQLKGMLKVRRALPPLYAVPTTAGTGSEATIAAVITDDEHHKFAVGDLRLIPLVAVLDPTLTYGMPAHVTAASGMDALSHAVEAYIGHSNTAATRKNAVEAVRLIVGNLETAYRDGTNREARQAMQQAAYLAGLAFTRANVGYVHAVAHALGGRYGLAHGAACAVVMPEVLRAYGKKAHRALAALYDAAGLTGAQTDAADAQKAAAVIAAVEALNLHLGLPKGFAEIQEEDIPILAAQAAREGNLFYPAPKVLAVGEIRQVLEHLKTEAA